MKKSSKVVKLSKEVIGWINQRKRLKGERTSESYDAALRRFFGIPTVKGEPQKLRTYFVLHNEGEPLIFLRKAEARGAAVIRAVRKKSKRAEPVLTVRGTPA